MPPAGAAGSGSSRFGGAGVQPGHSGHSGRRNAGASCIAPSNSDSTGAGGAGGGSFRCNAGSVVAAHLASASTASIFLSSVAKIRPVLIAFWTAFGVHPLCLAYTRYSINSMTSDLHPSPGSTDQPRNPHAPLHSCNHFTRSEEHTSELQSHSFISYAVFCLKKKNARTDPHNVALRVLVGNALRACAIG